MCRVIKRRHLVDVVIAIKRNSYLTSLDDIKNEEKIIDKNWHKSSVVVCRHGRRWTDSLKKKKRICTQTYVIEFVRLTLHGKESIVFFGFICSTHTNGSIHSSINSDTHGARVIRTQATYEWMWACGWRLTACEPRYDLNPKLSVFTFVMYLSIGFLLSGRSTSEITLCVKR